MSDEHKMKIFLVIINTMSLKITKGLQKANINRKYRTFSEDVSVMECHLRRPATPKKDSQVVVIHCKFIAGVNCAGEIPKFVNTNENNKVLRSRAH